MAPSNAILAFQAIDGFAPTAHVSYKGQTCATGTPQVSPTINSIVNDASFYDWRRNLYRFVGRHLRAGFAPVGDSRTWTAATEIVNGKLPVSLDGTSVTVNGKPASVEFIQPSQVNIQPPDDTAIETGAGRRNDSGRNRASHSPRITRRLLRAPSPAASPYVVAQRANNSYVTSAAPARAGEVIILWGTGFSPAAKSRRSCRTGFFGGRSARQHRNSDNRRPAIDRRFCGSRRRGAGPDQRTRGTGRRQRGRRCCGYSRGRLDPNDREHNLNP